MKKETLDKESFSLYNQNELKLKFKIVNIIIFLRKPYEIKGKSLFIFKLSKFFTNFKK